MTARPTLLKGFPMLPPRFSAVALTAAFALLGVGVAAPAQAKEPPACAAISFRTIVPGGPDGVQDAGLYKSRFAKIEIKADVKGGLGTNYYMVVNGARVDGPAVPPKLATSCLTAKNVKTPFAKQPAGTCVGDRFRVVIDRSSGKPVAAFFGLQNDAWSYCSATTL
jgi:hypothetical protein